MGREALPEVLTAITERPVGHWRAEVRSPAWRGISQVDATSRRPPRVRWKVEVDFARKTTRERSALLTVESPEAAVEVLSERGLWPWSPGDTDAPRWWCDDHDPRDEDHDTPPSLAALVAVASLGVATLRRVAELVRELHAVTNGETGATLVWRVMSAEALREHYQRETTTYAREEPFGRCLCKVFAHESIGSIAGYPPWPEASPYVPSRTAAAWPILRALAVHEDGTPTGLHLVAADKVRVVIAVEAL